MLFCFIQKSVKCCHIPLGFLVMQTLYIFSFLIEQYLTDTLESILKLLKKICNTLLNLKNIYYLVHTLVKVLDNDWAH